MTVAPPLSPSRHRGRYRTHLASPTEIEAAQRLRHQVFTTEYSALLGSPAASTASDVDEWDDRCDHLVVTDDLTGEVVGTYRLLPPEQATALGRTYGDGEFDLSRHAALRPATVEAGRSCVHPDHRTGAVITQLWAGIARYMFEREHRYLAGCASIPLADGGVTAAGVWDLVRGEHLAPAALRVVPHRPFDVESPARPRQLRVPPLVRGYLRLGARVCGRPAHDPAFGTADLYVLLDVDAVDHRVLRHLLGSAR